MICIVTRNLELADKLGKVIEGRKAFITGCEPPVLDKAPKRKKPYCGSVIEWARDEAQTRFRAQIHSWQPEVILLDATFGMNSFLALEQVPELLAVDSKPAVILLAPGAPESLKMRAAQLGCFDVISFRRRDVSSAVARSRALALDARRVGLAPYVTSGLPSLQLH